MEWISVKDKLPQPETKVLICADRKTYKGVITKVRAVAMYEDGNIHTENSAYCWEEHDFEYCEETEDYIIPEGWWEQGMYCDDFGLVDDFVTHWMPLPDAPIVL